MAPKNAAAIDQDISHSTAPLRAAASAFHAAVEECVQSANPDSVHRVRTGSRRLQAMIESLLRQRPALKNPATGWLQPLKRVRRAAGAVRDLDVHRKMLEHWTGEKSPLPVASSDSPLTSQAGNLDDWLRNQRKHLAHGMIKQIRKQQHPLLEAQAAFLAALDANRQHRGRAQRSPETMALENFVRAVDSMPLLHAENLHDFRKAIKKARYLAESGTAKEADSSVAKALKRVQDSIGEWHDWLCLQHEAKIGLKEEAPEFHLFLEHEVERHFAIAMKTTMVMRARLTGEWMASRRSAHGRPPASASTAVGRIASGF
jgi:CHAD domain-containing protein